MSETARILVVDDDELLRMAALRMLQAAGYETLSAADGFEALEIIRTRRPDLVLMDINMPRMDGLQTLREIKADAALASTFVVIVSGSRIDSESQVHGLETGADGYLVRPLTNRELLARVQALLRIKAAEDAVRQLNAELEARVEVRTRDLREAQEKLVRQEKLVVLGQLAGSVGHELRNPLAVISNAVYFLKIVLPDAESQVLEYLSMIERETAGAEKIITDLLDFARIKPLQREAVSIPNLLMRTLERFPPPESIRVSFDFPPDLPEVQADVQQIEQVFGNLIQNAYQALERDGELKLSAEQVGSLIRVTVQDNGVGILPENLPRLFEPLFSTKPNGIGLGLLISKNLVAAHGGEITVTSSPGVGSAFSVFLPSE
jgi:signal transduction histidine kinase